MPYRLSVLFSLTTNPVKRDVAAPRTAGWSETVWWGGTPINLAQGPLDGFLNARATMLPKEGSIIGYRLANAEITNDNRITYLGTTGARLIKPGNPAYSCGEAQDSLMCSYQSVNGVNVSRHSLRALPDECCAQGEYNPDRAFGIALASYTAILVNNAFQFVCHDLSTQDFLVMGITAGGVVSTSQAHNILAGQWVRFHRVKMDDKTTLKGSFLVNAVTANTITLTNWTGQTKTKSGGLVSRDMLISTRFETILGQLAVSRKVGRPFGQFRGRRSKRQT